MIRIRLESVAPSSRCMNVCILVCLVDWHVIWCFLCCSMLFLHAVHSLFLCRDLRFRSGFDQNPTVTEWPTARTMGWYVSVKLSIGPTSCFACVTVCFILLICVYLFRRCFLCKFLFMFILVCWSMFCALCHLIILVFYCFSRFANQILQDWPSLIE